MPDLHDLVPLLLLPPALLVASLARRLHLPAAVALMALGAAAAWLSLPVALSRGLLLDVLLPPLIFEAGLVLPWPLLRRELPVLLSIATAGVLVAALVVVSGLTALAGWPWQAAALFAALIAATDPVAVIAFFKEAGIGGRLRLLVEAESLFNDATAALLFGVLLSLAGGTEVAPGRLVLHFAAVCLASIAGGALLGWLASLRRQRSGRGLAGMLASVVAAYAAFLLAERLGGSGVLSTLVAGLLYGNRMACTEAAPDQGDGALLAALWRYLAMAANALVFVLIGVEAQHQGSAVFGRDALWALPLVLLGRCLAVVISSLPFAAGALRVPWSTQAVMSWGGLRGALAMALALELPAALPGRAAVLPVTCAVVLFSLLVQAGSLPWLVRRLEPGAASRPPR